MIFPLAMLFAFGVVIGPRPDGIVRDSFIRAGVTLKDFGRLTEGSRSGKTHLASNGSGFFITEDGYLVTNHHVIEDAVELVVVKDGVAYLADVKAKNRELDLALLKINAFPRPTDGVLYIRGLPRFVPLLCSDEPSARVGQTVLAVGFPNIDLQGIEPKVTRGIVSSLSGFKGEKSNFQMDAAIQPGNSGGPVVDEWGRLVGVSVAGLVVGQNVNYAVNLESVMRFLPKDIGFRSSVRRRRRATSDVVADVIKSTALILNYAEGSHGNVEHLASDVERREAQTELRKGVLVARMHKLRREWRELKRVTDAILALHGEVDDVRDMNDLARDELGLHLVLVAEADGRDVKAVVRPICGFKEKVVECERPTAVFGGRERRNFPVEAELTFEDDDWLWAGTFTCVYDWHGTKEVRIKMKRVGKKGDK